MSSVATPEEVCNLALDAIGYPASIADIFEGTKHARVGLRYYAETRDALLRAKDWPFSERFATAVSNGQTPPSPWLIEYAYPSDCLRLRYVQPLGSGPYPVLDPEPTLFKDFNETRTMPASKAILTNTSPARLIYTGQVVEIPLWEPNFVDTLVAWLARRFTVALRDGAQFVPTAEHLAQVTENIGLEAQVNVPPSPLPMPQGKG